MRDCPLDHPNGRALPVARWLPEGPTPDCILGTSKKELFARWKLVNPQFDPQDGCINLRPDDASQYDAILVYGLKEGDKVTKIVARHRQLGELSQPAAATKAMMAAWSQNAAAFGWPWQQTFNSQGHLQSWSNQDDAVQVRVFWYNNPDSGRRVWTEWK